MAQFCVIQGPLPERIDAKLGTQPLGPSAHAPAYLFEDASRLVIPTYLGRSIDEVLALSKAVYLAGAPFEKTDAFALFGWLLTCERHFVLWHGRDSAHLPMVDCADDVFVALRAALEGHACELYFDFRVPPWK